MKYTELIKKIQLESGFSDSESKESLDNLVECIAERLTEGERKDFASQLPEELQDIAMTTTMAPKEQTHEDIIAEFMEKEAIPEDRAKKQVLSAWSVLKSMLSSGEIKHIKSQMPNRAAANLF